MDLQDQKIGIIGAGRTGLAVAAFCLKRQAQVWLNDQRNEADLPTEVQRLKAQGVYLCLGTEKPTELNTCNIIILSPGVSPTNDLVSSLRAQGKQIWGEIEFASQFTNAPIVAVTGTNGKSTTVTFIQQMLLDGGKQSLLGGNIGTPFIELIDENDSPDVFVLELSSYQLETIETFHPHIAVLLNVSPDHLSRHQNLANYAAAKSRIFLNQDTSDWSIYNTDDPQVESITNSSRARRLPFSLRRAVSPGLFRQKQQIIWFHEGHQETYDLSQFSLVGDHQIENTMASIAAARLMGVELHEVQRTIDNFAGLAHRFEHIAVIRGIHFVNDSKATNVGAAIRAVGGVPEGHLILLAGGEDKGSSYQPLKDALIQQNAKAICVYGEAAATLQETFGDELPTFRSTTLEEAFSEALSRAQENDWVVLAPACASFDQFSNFEHRGDVFRQLVEQQNMEQVRVG